MCTALLGMACHLKLPHCTHPLVYLVHIGTGLAEVPELLAELSELNCVQGTALSNVSTLRHVANDC